MATNDRDFMERRTLGEAREPAPVLQWLGFLLAPAVFFAHLELAYLLIPWACTTRQEYWMHVVGAVAVLLALAGVVAAIVARGRTTDAEPHPPGHPLEGPGPLFRTRFLGDVGLGVGALLTLILFMQWLAGFFITVCQ